MMSTWGLSGPDREESAIKRLMLNRASKTVVLADNHKWNTAENYVIGSLGDIDYLVVEADKAEEARKMTAKYNCIVL